MVEIDIDLNKVREIAYLLSLEPKNYDDFVWLCAEAELRLNQPFVIQITYNEGVEGIKIEVDPNLFVTQPEEADIRVLAEKIAGVTQICKNFIGLSQNGDMYLIRYVMDEFFSLCFFH